MGGVVVMVSSEEVMNSSSEVGQSYLTSSYSKRPLPSSQQCPHDLEDEDIHDRNVDMDVCRRKASRAGNRGCLCR